MPQQEESFGRCQTVSDHDLCIGELVMFAEHSVHKSHTSAPPPPPRATCTGTRVLKYLYLIEVPTFSPSMIRPQGADPPPLLLLAPRRQVEIIKQVIYSPPPYLARPTMWPKHVNKMSPLRRCEIPLSAKW